MFVDVFKLHNEKKNEDDSRRKKIRITSCKAKLYVTLTLSFEKKKKNRDTKQSRKTVAEFFLKILLDSLKGRSHYKLTGKLSAAKISYFLKKTKV